MMCKRLLVLTAVTAFVAAAPVPSLAGLVKPVLQAIQPLADGIDQGVTGVYLSQLKEYESNSMLKFTRSVDDVAGVYIFFL
jgi:hypothetical protein